MSMDEIEAKYQFKKIGNTADHLLVGIHKFKANHKDKHVIDSTEVNSLLNYIECELALIKESVERPFTSDS